MQLSEISTKEYRLLPGDAMQQLDNIPDNSVDTIITDPPYEIQMMQAAWDSTGIAFSVDLWKKALRVAKPGCILLCFGSTRTFHRIACAIEDAGWEIKDCMSYMYGCLSEDTEILTNNGWKRYSKSIEDSLVLTVNIETNQFCFEKPLRSFFYENKHTAYRISSCDTDQIVSRNHRCVVERDGVDVFAMAETLKQEEIVPFLESLQDLPENIPVMDSRSCIKKTLLLQKMYQQTSAKHSPQKNTNVFTKWSNRNKLRGVWNKGVEKQLLFEKHKNSHLFQSVQRKNTVQNPARSHGRQMGYLEQDNRQGTVCSCPKTKGKVHRRQKPCLDWRQNCCSQTVWMGSICEMSNRVCRNGDKKWICRRTQINNGPNNWSFFDQNRSSSSYRPQYSEQSNFKLNAICQPKTSQVIRSTRAKIDEIDYKGNLWCVATKSGAFVARRNGKIFITGNSGMPKGIDLAKAVGKIEGQTQDENGECKEWFGWNSTLKPSYEPIIVAMKPTVLTFAENAIQYGVAGFNINAGRIKHKNKIDLDNSKPKGQWTTKKQSIGATPDAGRNIERVPYDISDERKEAAQKGRYPTNTLLFHHEDCKMVGKRKVKGTKPHPVYSKTEKYEGWGNITQKSGEVVNRFEDADGFETIEDWDCHENCPVRIMDEQSGIRTSGTGALKKASSAGHERNVYGAENRPYGQPQLSYGDTGGASRFFYTSKASRKERNLGLPAGVVNDHKTVKPLKLMQYLCNLTKTPTNGTVLDLFMGSGTTGMACAYTGRQFIGIEKDDHHFDLCRHRIEFAYASKRKKTLKVFK